VLTVVTEVSVAVSVALESVALVTVAVVTVVSVVSVSDVVGGKLVGPTVVGVSGPLVAVVPPLDPLDSPEIESLVPGTSPQAIDPHTAPSSQNSRQR
jgi:hypothetical protein